MGAAVEVWSVYILQCADGTLSTGVTKDLDRRCRQHDAGTASRFTRGRRPVALVYHEAHASRRSALKREVAIKAMSRRQKESSTSERQRGKVPGSAYNDGRPADQREGVL
jgi:predicted GIY-YIG superfamily endonuclease